jgi:hypothetical protein
VQVSGFVVPTASGPAALERARRGRGWAALLVVRLNNGAVFKSLHGFLEAGQQAWVRIHGDRGLMENLRHGDTRTLRVVWDAAGDEEGQRADEVYLPWPPEFSATDADPLGDGVAETLMLRDFASAVRRGAGPPPGRVLRGRAVHYRDPGDALQPRRECARRGSRPAPPRHPPIPGGRRLVP